MSMQIDLNSPLTQEERTYLLDRGRYAEVERVDSLHGVESPELPAGDGTGPALQGTTIVDRQNLRIEELERQLAALKGESAEDEESAEEGDLSPYEEWTVSELDTELKRRNLPVKGDKNAKITALYDYDDAAGA